jgi:hypothetical protein
MYKLREERDMKPSTFGALVSSMLYEKRYAAKLFSHVNLHVLTRKAWMLFLGIITQASLVMVLESA